MKNAAIIIAIVLSLTGLSFAQDAGFVIDNYEIIVSGGPEGTLDFGAGNGSSVQVSTATDIKFLDNSSIKVIYDAVAGGYIFVARGFGLDAKNSGWDKKPEDSEWEKYNAIAFYMYGDDSKAKIAFDVKDSGNELWRFIVEDNFKGWKQMVCPFSEFYPRGDWQPEDADKNGVIDFPLKSYQYEPLPVAKGVLYFDKVELIKK